MTTEQRWAKEAAKHLCGRKIVNVRYMTDEEMEDLGWSEKSLVIRLDNGHMFFASSDDEGNGAGALFTTFEELETIPVI